MREKCYRNATNLVVLQDFPLVTPLSTLAHGSRLRQGERKDVDHKGNRRDQERKEHVVVLLNAPGFVLCALGGKWQLNGNFRPNNGMNIGHRGQLENTFILSVGLKTGPASKESIE